MIFSCFGNSLTAGYPGYNPTIDGITQGNGNYQSQYEYWLKKLCLEFIEERNGLVNGEFTKELIFVNKGIPGETSTGLLHRIDKDVVNFKPKPDYSIIIIGTNDLGWGLNSDNIFKNIQKLHDISRENNITSIGGLIPPITKRASIPSWNVLRSDLNEELKSFFVEKEIQFTDYRHMTDNDDYLKQEYTSGDGVHFSVLGYKQMGYGLFQDVLKKII